MEMNNPKRAFKIGKTIIKDVNSHLPFELALKTFFLTHKFVKRVPLFMEDGVVQADGTLLYDIPVIPPKHNG
ncbi:hypothetical protein [Vibrio barjaei]|uniref:hypothetical protein n=1 Tax=Vibrio barjaei TaxID=1676683 RepID=UPI002284F56C|nr:hypothetical protein [Vibrio barjaei]MCY9870504.1 hypothetical protein [Vibrio barjaei]